jgi:glutamate racemase
VAANREGPVLVFDSGLGGLTVFAPLAKQRPDLDLVYLADDAGFPYGRWTDETLVERVADVIGAAIETYDPALVVIACNTASTIALADLRARFPALPFVGTVPAIKPAAAASRSRRISVLATRATVQRDYTRRLIADHGAGCEVTLVGAAHLAEIAEASLRGLPVDEALVVREIAPAFVEANGARTDHIVLACTHFPLLAPLIERFAPWPVTLVDPGPAIARRVDSLAPAGSGGGTRRVVFTSESPPEAALLGALAGFGLAGEPSRLRAPPPSA